MKARVFAAFSQDGELFAIARSGNAKVVATRTSAVLQKIAISPKVRGLAFSQAGQLLAVAGSDKVCIHSISDGRCLTLPLPGILVEFSGRFSPSDELYAFTSTDHSVRMWQAKDNGKCTALVGHSSEIHDVVFMQNGRLLASACSKECIVWYISSETRLYSIPNNGGNAEAPVMSPNGKLLAWGTGRRSVTFWCSDGGLPLGTLSTIAACSSMAFSPNSQQLAYLTGKSLINIWSVNKLLNRLTGKTASQTVSCITTTSDGKLLAFAMLKGPVMVWVEEQKVYRVLLTTDIEHAASLAFSSNCTQLAILCRKGIVKVVDIATGNQALEVQSERYHRQAFSLDSQFLALLTSVGRVEVHDLCTKFVKEFPFSSDIDKIAFSPDGKSLAGTSTSRFSIFGGSTRKFAYAAAVAPKSAIAAAVALSPDGQWLACSVWIGIGNGCEIRLLDMTQIWRLLRKM